MYKDKPTCQQTNRGSVAWVPLSKRKTIFFQWDSNPSTCCEFIYPFPCFCSASMADFRMLQMPCSTHPCDGEEAGGEDQPSEHLNMHEKATWEVSEDLELFQVPIEKGKWEKDAQFLCRNQTFDAQKNLLFIWQSPAVLIPQGVKWLESPDLVYGC